MPVLSAKVNTNEGLIPARAAAQLEEAPTGWKVMPRAHPVSWVNNSTIRERLYTGQWYCLGFYYADNKLVPQCHLNSLWEPPLCFWTTELMTSFFSFQQSNPKLISIGFWLKEMYLVRHLEIWFDLSNKQFLIIIFARTI